MPVHESAHPLIAHKLSHMRRHESELPSAEFTRLMREMGRLLAYEVTQDLVLPASTRRFAAQNGGEIPARTLGPKKPVIVPILRGGLVLAEGLMDVVPTTYTGHLGMHYDPDIHAEPLVYLVTLPEDVSGRIFILADPVVATGVTACRAIGLLREFAIPEAHIRLVAVIVSGTARTRISAEYPRVQVYCAAVDDEVRGNVVIPGIGAVSSRLYRTGHDLIHSAQD